MDWFGAGRSWTSWTNPISNPNLARKPQTSDGGGQVTSSIKHGRRSDAIGPQRLYGGGGLGVAHSVPGPPWNRQLDPHHLIAFVDICLHLVVQCALLNAAA